MVYMEVAFGIGHVLYGLLGEAMMNPQLGNTLRARYCNRAKTPPTPEPHSSPLPPNLPQTCSAKASARWPT
jgi:hypothetical protein